MTVDPRLQLTPGEYLIHPDGSASKVVDGRNMTVDEILETGQYTDRRGRAWDYFDMRVDYDRWQRWESRGEEDLILDPDEMRLLIERDLHRDECHIGGASNCLDHPVPVVYWAAREYAWMARPAGWWQPGEDVPLYSGLPEAMDAARALAVGE